MSTIIISVIIAVMFLAIVFHNRIPGKKKSGSGCGGHCSGCCNSSFCHPVSKETVKESKAVR